MGWRVPVIATCWLVIVANSASLIGLGIWARVRSISMWTRTFSCCNVCSTYLMPCSASGMRSPAYAVTQVSWMSVLLLPVWIVDSCRMTSICFPVASTTQAWWKYFPTSMSMAKSKEIEVLLAMLHSLLRCVSLDVLDMLCVCIHITVRPHIGRGRRLRSHERCGVCRCLRWHHPQGHDGAW